MNIGIIGQGAWGSALGEALKRNGYDPSFFDRVINENDLSKCDGFVLAVPAQATRDVLLKTKHILEKKPLLITAKGIEKSTGLFQSQVIENVLSNPVWSILSGPTFASEVVQNLPCAAVLSSMKEKTSHFWLPLFSHSTFRLYLQDDYLGVQMGGAIKNVIAIASGILTGLDAGENARAALLTRALAEMMRFGVAHGAKAATFMGLSGIGDLMLTATSAQSRNFSLGLALAQGRVDVSKGVKEGALTASILIEKACEKNIHMPICQTVHDIIVRNISPKTALEALMLRPSTSE